MSDEQNRATIVRPPDPGIDVGSTYYLTDAGQKSVSQVSFAKPRSLVAYVYWSPEQNGGVDAAAWQDSGNHPLQVLGQLKIGNQQAIITFNFDVPYGQLVAIPVTASTVELLVRIIRPVVTTGGPPITFGAFNNPPIPTDIPTPFALPNANSLSKYPTGYVAITGGIGVGSSTPRGASPPTRSAQSLDPLAAHGSTFCPLAFGARRVVVIADPVARMSFVRGGGAGLGPSNLPVNQTYDLPPGTTGINLDNPSGAAIDSPSFVWELGI